MRQLDLIAAAKLPPGTKKAPIAGRLIGVEMGGIEPPSSAHIVRILRVQLREGVLLGSDLCPEHLGRRAQSQCKSRDAL